MKHIFRRLCRWGIKSLVRVQKQLSLIILVGFLTTCSDFVEVDLPKQLLTSQTVFESPSTTEAVLRSIYANMIDGSPTGSSVTFFIGLYADELDFYDNNPTFLSFLNHTINPSLSQVSSWWSVAYNLIYEANALIEGVEFSTFLTSEEQDQFMGEALFIRAYLHFMLVELYGEIPYIITTDYITNTTVSRMPKDLVYEQIIKDLDLAQELLPEEDFSVGGEKTRPYAAVANALLARVYLYNQDWDEAEEAATDVIKAFGGLELDLDKVFLKESPETIWQFKPGADGDNTEEGANLILELPPNILGGMTLTEYLAEAFESGDLRREHWTGQVSSFTPPFQTWHYALKYKQDNSTETSLEYPIQFRLAEQYLIRAEAIAQQGEDIPGAQADLNTIRNRAGLGNTSASSLNELLDAILQERQVELFTEHAHRWFDLKRMRRAKEVLEPIKPNWKDTNVLLPIPESELLLNPSLLPQNDGY